MTNKKKNKCIMLNNTHTVTKQLFEENAAKQQSQQVNHLEMLYYTSISIYVMYTNSCIIFV